jgi:hypothetical protein
VLCVNAGQKHKYRKKPDNLSKAIEDVGLENNKDKTKYLACRDVAG